VQEHARNCLPLWKALDDPKPDLKECSQIGLKKLSDVGVIYARAECEKAKTQYIPDIKQRLKSERCANPFSDEVLIPMSPTGPGEFRPWADKYVWEDQKDAAFNIFMFLVLAPLVLLQVGRLYIKEQHLGWRRLALVAPGVVSLLTLGYWMVSSSRYSGPSSAEMTAGTIATFCATLGAVLIGRLIFGWVRSGFTPGKGAVGDGSSSTGHKAPGEVHFESTAPSPLTNVGSALEPIRRLAQVANSVASAPAGPNATSPDAALQEGTRASYWHRVWARALDLMLVAVIASTLGEFLPSPQFVVSGVMGLLLDRIVAVLVYCAVVVAYDWVLLPKFGTSPGKALFGLSVRTPEGLLIARRAAYQRAWHMLKNGLYFMVMFPYLQLVSVFIHAKSETLPWDFTGRAVVYQRPIGEFRRFFGILLAVVLVAGMAVLQQALKAETKREAHDLTIKGIERKLVEQV